MTGGLVQLASPGAEQAFLVGNDSTFWRAAFHRHTNFAIESVRQDFQNPPALGGQASAIVGRNGDLVKGLVLELTVTRAAGLQPGDAGWEAGGHYPAENVVRDVAFSLGGQVVDRHTADFLRVFDAVYRSPAEAEQYRRLTNFDPGTVAANVATTETLYLPLSFWCCRHEGLALPMISLYNTEAKLTISFADVPGLTLVDAAVYVDYVYLDSPERKFMLDTPQSYLIEQVQTQEFTLPDTVLTDQSATSYTARLGLFRPVKALHWVLRDAALAHPRYLGDHPRTVVGFQPTPSAPSGIAHVQTLSERLAPVAGAVLRVGGRDRFSTRKGTYFNRVQPFQHAPGCPPPGIYMYSFGLRPGDAVQSSGTANFSTLEDAELVLALKRSTADPRQAHDDSMATGITNMKRLVVMAWSLNVLRIQDGGVQLAFGSAGPAGPA